MTQRTRNWLLLAPAGTWFLVMLLLPLTVVLVFSFGERAPAGGVELAFSLEQYVNLPARWTAFKNTMTLAPIGTLASLLIAYPLAYFLAVRVDAKWNSMKSWSTRKSSSPGWERPSQAHSQPSQSTFMSASRRPECTSRALIACRVSNSPSTRP